MSIDQLIDDARDLPVEATAALGAIAGFLLILAIAAQLSARRLRRELQLAEEELVDEKTGLMPRSAIRVRLGAELAWASTSRTPVAVAAMRIRGSRFTHAAKVLRHAMREEEGAFLLGEQRVALELWGVDPDAAAVATRRLGEDLARAGHPVVDVGVACMPRDGSDVETLVAAAERDLRPVDDPRPPASDVGADGAARGSVNHAAALLLGVLPWFAAMGLLLLVTWRLVPAAIEPALAGDRSGSDLARAIVAAIGVPLGAALLHVSCWNRGGGAAPSSHPIGRAGLRLGVALALVVGIPLAWGIFAPTTPGDVTDGFGASLAVIALVLLALVHARQLVHAPAPVLAGLAAIGGAITWWAVDVATYPVVANSGRLLLAAALGALLARFIERASWIVLLALLAGGVDAWSVAADSGVTNRVLDAAGRGEDGGLLDLLLFTGPIVADRPLFQIGVTDLVFLAMFIAWSHDWRVDLRIATTALHVAAWTAAIASELRADVVPMLPFLCAAMIAVVGIRSFVLRRRVRTWRADPAADPAVTSTAVPAA
ncbi:MAG: hypothetical protein JWL76_1300 [Thermoleophilia bacterium]|nr:hypothetical protein [Thermoleophilia bacterium]